MNINVSKLEGSALSYMYECCERLHQSPAYADQAMCIYQNMTKDRKLSLGISVKNEKAAAATFSYILYSVFIKEGCLVTIDEICLISGCVRRKLWKIARQDPEVNSFIIKPIQMLNRYINFFKVTRAQKDLIRLKCCELDNYIGHSPKTVVAYSIYSILQGGESNYTLKNICAIIGITPTCVFRLRRIVENKDNRLFY